uniref:Uncharacterized protein n=1 Tax=Anguilla anguilla TaxID=7936 RepID=A0A0E9XCD8_ANGAN
MLAMLAMYGHTQLFPGRMAGAGRAMCRPCFWRMYGHAHLFTGRTEEGWKQASCRCMLLLKVFRSSSRSFLSAPL